jgi:hypothetical protein
LDSAIETIITGIRLWFWQDQSLLLLHFAGGPGIYGLHSPVLVVLYVELVVYCGFLVIFALQDLSIRHPSIVPNYMAQRGRAKSKD